MAIDGVEYVEIKPNGSYFYNAPKAARSAGILTSCVLGFDKETALEKASQYNRTYSEWKKASKRKDVEDVKPIIDTWQGHPGGESKNPYKPGTFNQVAWRYIKSNYFTDLSKKTQEGYIGFLGTLLLSKSRTYGTIGAMPIKSMTKGMAQELYKSRRGISQNGTSSRLVAANNEMKCAALLWEFAATFNEVVGNNPFHRMRKKSPPSRRTRWSHAQVMNFVSAAFQMKFEGIGLAVMIAYEHAQRMGDVIRMRRDNYTGTHIHFNQSKTDAPIYHPVTPPLKDMIDRVLSSHNSDYIIINVRKKVPYSGTDGMRQQFRKICEKAGLDRSAGLWLMDLRRSGAMLYAEAGATDDEIRTMTGHKTREIVKTYVPVNDVLASNAMSKRAAYINKRESGDSGE